MPRRVLIDECIPSRFRRELGEFNAISVRALGWAGTKNGELLAKMWRHGFEVLITVDKNIVREIDLLDAGVAVVVVRAVSNDYEALAPLLPNVRAAVHKIAKGEWITVGHD